VEENDNAIRDGCCGIAVKENGAECERENGSREPTRDAAHFIRAIRRHFKSVERGIFTATNFVCDKTTSNKEAARWLLTIWPHIVWGASDLAISTPGEASCLLGTVIFGERVSDNSAKELEAIISRNSFVFSALVGVSGLQILKFFGLAAGPFNHRTVDVILFAEAKGCG